KPAFAAGHLGSGAHDLMRRPDIEIMHQMAVLNEEAVAGRHVAVGDENTFAWHLYIGFDQIAAAAQVGRNVGRYMAHTGVKHELASMALHTRRILGKARAESIIEGKHLVALRRLPPARDHRLEPPRVLVGEVVGFRKILVEMIKLPAIALEGRAG